MSKRSFRPAAAEPPAYPTDDELHARDRRQLLQRLAALLGLGLLFPRTALAGDKAKKKDEKKKREDKKKILRPPGVAPHPHAALDEGDTPDDKKKPDKKKPDKKPDKKKPDLPPPGVPPHPHAAIDE